MARGVVTTSGSKASGCQILPCTCKSEFQDKKYGVGRRVKNNRPGGKVRCTVCGKD